MGRSIEWRSGSWAFDQPCLNCGKTRREHDPRHERHQYRTPAVAPEEIDHDSGFWDFTNDTTGGTAQRALNRHWEREANGAYSAPLPPPCERKRIRERAGLTQEELAKELFVERTTVSRWEQPAGYTHGRRLNGREPVGDRRRDYSNMLRDLVDASSD